MAKPLSFKDFMVVDYLPGTGEYISYQSKGDHDTSGTVESRNGNEPTTTEALSHSQRIKASLRMKKMSKRIKLARQRALKRTPSMDVVKKRAMKKARITVLKRLTKGASKNELSFARRQEIENRLNKMSPKIQRLAKKLIPTVRKLDRERKANKSEIASSEK